MPVTQFADKCSIPRPTLSQLLNGRNTKVSDVLISKLHTAFPQLNVSWLLFGEGDMLVNSNMQTSAPQNPGLFDIVDSHKPEQESVGTQIEFGDELQHETPEKSEAESFEAPTSIEVPVTPTGIVLESGGKSKSVEYIIVYYSDKSFESFIPGSPKGLPC